MGTSTKVNILKNVNIEILAQRFTSPEFMLHAVVLVFQWTQLFYRAWRKYLVLEMNRRNLLTHISCWTLPAKRYDLMKRVLFYVPWLHQQCRFNQIKYWQFGRLFCDFCKLMVIVNTLISIKIKMTQSVYDKCVPWAAETPTHDNCKNVIPYQ